MTNNRAENKKKSKKLFQKLSRVQKSAAGDGDGVRSGTKN